MTKDEFLQTLDRKLNIINERERKDIIDEYRTHIEMKINEGKSEEETIADFGDIDELVDEILDAYKINRNHTNSYEAKFNQFMDSLYDGFKRVVSSFTKLDVDDVVRLIFEIFVVLIILTILKIPFDLISSLGSSLFHSLIGLGIGNMLAFLWRLVIGIAYIAVFVLVLVSVITKRVDRYRTRSGSGKSVFDDLKDSVHSMKGTASKQLETYTYQSDDYQEERTNDDLFEEQMKEQVNDDIKHDSSWRFQRDERDIHPVMSVLDVFMKIFYIFMMIPFMTIIIGLCCALGTMIVLSVQGVTLFGPYFLVVGGLFVTGAFLTALYRVLWRRR